MKKLTSVPNLNTLSQKLANPLPNVALHFLIGIPFFHTLSLIKGCEEKKSERLENGYCPVEKTMIIQET